MILVGGNTLPLLDLEFQVSADFKLTQVNLTSTGALQSVKLNLKYFVGISLTDVSFLPGDVGQTGSMLITQAAPSVAGPSIRLESVTFTGIQMNLATYPAFALVLSSLLSDAYLEVRDCTFSNNLGQPGPFDASALWVKHMTSFFELRIVMANVIFQNNGFSSSTGATGGAMTIACNNCSIEIGDCLFDNNEGELGTAWSFEGVLTDWYMHNTSFQSNQQAALSIILEGPGNWNWTDVDFGDNGAALHLMTKGDLVWDWNGGSVNTSSAVKDNFLILHQQGNLEWKMTSVTFDDNQQSLMVQVTSAAQLHARWTNCVFQNQLTTNNVAHVVMSSTATDNYLIITNCVFTNNTRNAFVLESGVTVNFAMAVNIQQSTFTNNGVAALFNLGDFGLPLALSITGSTISNHNFDTALQMRTQSQMQWMIDNCTFSANTATLSGGAIYFQYDPNGLNSDYMVLDWTNTVFDGNIAAQWGGAVRIVHANNEKLQLDLSMRNVVFRNNEANMAGAMAVSVGQHNVSLQDVTAEFNSATLQGGAFLMEVNSSALAPGYFAWTIQSGTFFANSAQSGSAMYVSCGSILAANATLNVTSSNFAHNNARDNGALFFKAEFTDYTFKTHFQYNHFDSNNATNAASIYAKFGALIEMEFIDNRFENGNCSGPGAAMWLVYATAINHQLVMNDTRLSYHNSGPSGVIYLQNNASSNLTVQLHNLQSTGDSSTGTQPNRQCVIFVQGDTTSTTHVEASDVSIDNASSGGWLIQSADSVRLLRGKFTELLRLPLAISTKPSGVIVLDSLIFGDNHYDPTHARDLTVAGDVGAQLYMMGVWELKEFVNPPSPTLQFRDIQVNNSASLSLTAVLDGPPPPKVWLQVTNQTIDMAAFAPMESVLVHSDPTQQVCWEDVSWLSTSDVTNLVTTAWRLVWALKPCLLVSLPNTTTIVISGNYTVPANVTLVMPADTTVVIQDGCLTLEGNLSVVVTPDTQVNVSHPLFQGCLQGQFGTVLLNNSENTGICTLEPAYNALGMDVTFQSCSDQVTASFPVGAIVGIVVGSVVLLIVVALLLIFLVKPIHRRVFPNRGRYVDDDDDVRGTKQQNRKTLGPDALRNSTYDGQGRSGDNVLYE